MPTCFGMASWQRPVVTREENRSGKQENSVRFHGLDKNRLSFFLKKKFVVRGNGKNVHQKGAHFKI